MSFFCDGDEIFNSATILTFSVVSISCAVRGTDYCGVVVSSTQNVCRDTAVNICYYRRDRYIYIYIYTHTHTYINTYIHTYIEEFYIAEPRMLLGRRDKKYMQNVVRNPNTLCLFGRYSKGRDSNVKA